MQLDRNCFGIGSDELHWQDIAIFSGMRTLTVIVFAVVSAPANSANHVYV
jgi:hypothetical protein